MIFIVKWTNESGEHMAVYATAEKVREKILKLEDNRIYDAVWMAVFPSDAMWHDSLP